jgi:PAS domain S-box-containing protein
MSAIDNRVRLDEISLLHVDDDAEFAALASTFLERVDERLDVETASSSEAGLDRLAEGGVDCVVSDYDMPETDGIEFLEAVREDYPELPFILYTGKGSETVASEAFSAGATDYLQKERGTEQYTLLANKVTNYVEKYRTEREMRRRAQAMETANEGIALVDADGHYVSVNEAYADICRSAPAEIVGTHWASTLPEAEAERLRTEALPELAAQSSWTGEATGQREDGSTYAKRLSLSALDDGGHVCAVRDITDRKANERELSRARRKFRKLFTHANDAIFIVDPARDEFVDCNPAAAELLGTTKERVLTDLSPSQTHPDEVMASLQDFFDRTLEQGHGWTDDAPIVTADGEVRSVEMSAAYLELDDCAYLVNIVRDVTDRRQRQWQLRRYKRIVEVSGDPVYTLDTEGHFTFVNDRLVDWTGYDRADLDGEHISLLLDDDDVETGRRLIQSLLTGDDDRNTLEMDIVTADDDTITCENHIALVLDDGEFEGTVGILRDITDRKRRAEELERKNDRLERFTSLVSHDLRNPLNVAQGRLELARTSDDPSAHLDDAANALGRCQQLVDDLLTLAREGDNVDDTDAVALDTVAENCWRHVETNGATLVVDADATVEADRSRLQQLLENLVHNAVDHGSTGSEERNPSDSRPAVDDNQTQPSDAVEHGSANGDGTDHGGVTVTIGAVADGFYVADDGPGIPADERDRVFDSGYSTADDGTGFGLSIVREIAEAHGWTVDIKCSAEGGARIEVTGVEHVGGT